MSHPAGAKIQYALTYTPCTTDDPSQGHLAAHMIINAADWHTAESMTSIVTGYFDNYDTARSCAADILLTCVSLSTTGFKLRMV